MITHPEPDLLRTYVTIVETGSFTGAARKVHRTQAAVSMQIRRLEESIGRSLFVRAGRRTRLTPYGEIYLDHARRILHLYDQALAALSDTDNSDEVTIGVPDDYALTFLPQILERFVRSLPSVRLTIICEPSRRLSVQIVEGTIDLALLTEGEGIGGGVVLRREELVWATSAHHSVHEQDPVPIAIFHSGDIFRRKAVQMLEESGRRSRIVVSSVSYAGIHAALVAGIAVAAISVKNIHPGLRVLTERDGFPSLPNVGIMLQWSDREPRQIVGKLVRQIVTHGRCRSSGLS